MTTTSEFFHFGVDVDVQPPPAGEVVDALELVDPGELRQAMNG